MVYKSQLERYYDRIRANNDFLDFISKFENTLNIDKYIFFKTVRKSLRPRIKYFFKTQYKFKLMKEQKYTHNHIMDTILASKKKNQQKFLGSKKFKSLLIKNTKLGFFVSMPEEIKKYKAFCKSEWIKIKNQIGLLPDVEKNLSYKKSLYLSMMNFYDYLQKSIDPQFIENLIHIGGFHELRENEDDIDDDNNQLACKGSETFFTRKEFKYLRTQIKQWHSLGFSQGISYNMNSYTQEYNQYLGVLCRSTTILKKTPSIKGIGFFKKKKQRKFKTNNNRKSNLKKTQFNKNELSLQKVKQNINFNLKINNNKKTNLKKNKIILNINSNLKKIRVNNKKSSNI